MQTSTIYKTLSHNQSLCCALVWLVFSFYLHLSTVSILFSYNALKAISFLFIYSQDILSTYLVKQRGKLYKRYTSTHYSFSIRTILSKMCKTFPISFTCSICGIYVYVCIHVLCVWVYYIDLAFLINTGVRVPTISTSKNSSIPLQSAFCINGSTIFSISHLWIQPNSDYVVL